MRDLSHKPEQKNSTSHSNPLTARGLDLLWCALRSLLARQSRTLSLRS